MNRKELSLKDKVEVLRYLEKNNPTETAKYFGVSRTTVNNIRKNKAAIMERLESGDTEMLRKRRKTNNDDVNNAALLWYRKMTDLNIKVTDTTLQIVALKFSRDFGNEDFHASYSWLTGFQKRNHIPKHKRWSANNNFPFGEKEENVYKHVMNQLKGVKTKEEIPTKEEIIEDFSGDF